MIRKAAPDGASGARGFTLLEMMIVLAVLGLALGLLLARGPVHSQRLDLDATARQIAGALRLARSRAIAEDRVVAVVFTKGGYLFDHASLVTWPSDIVARADATMTFSPDGESSGGGVLLEGGGRRIAIGVDWLTGYARLR